MFIRTGSTRSGHSAKVAGSSRLSIIVLRATRAVGKRRAPGCIVSFIPCVGDVCSATMNSTAHSHLKGFPIHTNTGVVVRNVGFADKTDCAIGFCGSDRLMSKGVPGGARTSSAMATAFISSKGVEMATPSCSH